MLLQTVRHRTEPHSRKAYREAFKEAACRPREDNMTTTAHEMHEAETRDAAAGLGTNEQFEVWKSKAADVLSSPYVRGAAVLGITAASYALLRRKKAPASSMAP